MRRDEARSRGARDSVRVGVQQSRPVAFTPPPTAPRRSSAPPTTPVGAAAASRAAALARARARADDADMTAEAHRGTRFAWSEGAAMVSGARARARTEAHRAPGRVRGDVRAHFAPSPGERARLRADAGAVSPAVYGGVRARSPSAPLSLIPT